MNPPAPDASTAPPLFATVLLATVAVAGASLGIERATAEPAKEQLSVRTVGTGEAAVTDAVLRLAAAAQNLYRTNTGSYTTSMEELLGAGFHLTEGYQVTLISGDAASFCMQARPPEGEPMVIDTYAAHARPGERC